MNGYAGAPGINWSTLKYMAASPLEYRWALDHPREDAPSLLLGRAVHCAMLEPAAYAERYATPAARQCGATTKKGARCTNSALPFATLCGIHGGHDEVDAYRLAHPGVEVLDAEQGAIVSACAAAVRAHPVASLVFDGVQTEQVIEWTIDGRRCKGRVDALNRLWLADLKTTHDLGKFLRRDFWAYLTHGQLAWYHDGAIATGALDPGADVYVVAVRSTRPVDVAVREIDDGTIAAGRALYRQLLKRLAECEASGEWPGAHPGLETMEMPRWVDGAEMTNDSNW